MSKTIILHVPDDEEADFMVDSIRGVAKTNGIELRLEQNIVPPKFLSDELRKRILEDADFLTVYAHSNFMGDGLEQDHAAWLLGQVDDDSLSDEYSVNGQDPGIVAELRQLGKWGGGELCESLGLIEEEEGVSDGE